MKIHFFVRIVFVICLLVICSAPFSTVFFLDDAPASFTTGAIASSTARYIDYSTASVTTPLLGLLLHRLLSPHTASVNPICPSVSFSPGAPKLLLHIGPWKTGSTTLQSEVSRCTKRGLYAGWPVMNGIADRMIYANLGWCLTNKSIKKGKSCYTNRKGNSKEVKQISEFLADVAGQKVVSAENFAKLAPAQIQDLACFVSGYDVTVVFVYRNGASLMLSLHNQITGLKGAYGPARTFEEFMKRTNWTQTKMLNAELVISDYISVFGEDRMKVVDLDGLASSNKDLTSATLEVGGLNPFPEQCIGGKMNSADSLDTALLNEAFSRWAKDQRNCAMRRDKTGSKQMVESLQHWKRFGLPRTCIDLSGLRAKARSRDAECRARYGHLFQFANSTATDLAIEKHVEHCEVDVDGMAANATWQKRFEEAYDELKQLCKKG